MRPLKICIIGEAGHAQYVVNAAKYNQDIIITAVSDGLENRGCNKILQMCKKENYNIKKYDNYLEMLQQEHPNIAVVNGYCGYNAEVSIKCMEYGAHVFSEKPLATDYDNLEKLKAYSKRKKLLISPMMTMRSESCFFTAKEAIQNGIIGNIRLLNAQKSYRLGKRGELYTNDKLYGGTIPWVGSHAVDWIYWFTQKKFISVYSVQSHVGNHGHGSMEITATCNFKMEDDICATITMDYLRPQAARTHSDDRFRVVGTEGILEVKDNMVYVINQNGEEILSPIVADNIFTEFVKAVLNKDNNAISAEDGFYITEVCLKARQSALEDRVMRI